MKKFVLFSVFLISCLLFTGCGKYGEKDLVKDLAKKIENSKSYHINGELEIINNEDNYLYQVEVSYEKDDKFRVSLKNKINNHEQIILKNSDGVYVLTPSLNKSFKFQSEWPYNNSQAYLLQTILKDIQSDKERTFKTTEDGYLLTTKVNYANNKNLVKQNIYIDKNLNINEVHILNSEDQVQMKMKFTDVDMKANYKDNYFTLKENMTSSEVEETTSKIEDIIYPMYMPINTFLSSQDKVSKEDGERVILTFEGEKPFMFVQETISTTDEPVTIPLDGEPYLLSNTVAALTDSSITWVDNGVEYYLVSSALSVDELLSVASSVSVMAIGK